MKKWAALGVSPKVVSPQGRLHPPIPVKGRFDQVINYNKLLCESLQEPLPGGGIASAYEQKCSRTGPNSDISRGLQQTFSGPKTQQPVETYTRPQYPEQVFKDRVIQNRDTRDNKCLWGVQAGEWVTSIDAYFHILIHCQFRRYMHFQVQHQSYQFKAIPFGLSTAPMEFTVVGKEVKLLALQRGIRIYQHLVDWLFRARSHQTCLQHTQTLVALSGNRLVS